MRKTLIQSLTLDLRGQTEDITVSEFRRNPGDIFLQVQMGKKFLIRRNGRVIAELHAPEKNALELAAEIRRMKLAG